MPTAAPQKTAIGAMVKPADVTALARSVQALTQKLADTEAQLKREKSARADDADTIAEMLVRIVRLEKRVEEAEARARDAEARARQRASTKAPPPRRRSTRPPRRS